MKNNAAYLIPVYIVVACIGVQIALRCWKRRTTPGATPLAIYSMGLTWWTLATLVCVIFHTSIPKDIRIGLGYIGIVVLPPAWLAFTMRFSGRMEPFSRWGIGAAVVIGLTMVGLVFTNDSHQLFQLGRAQGVAYWIFVSYAYVCGASGIIILLQRMLEQPPAYRLQFLIMIGSGLAPIMANIVDDVLQPFGRKIEFSSLGFGLSTLMAWHGLFRFRVLDLRGVPQYILFAAIRDGILVFDNKQRIVDFNSAAAKMLPELTPDIIGMPADKLPFWPQVKDFCAINASCEREISLSQGTVTNYFEVRANPFTSSSGKNQGCLLLFQNVTERHKVRAENEELVQQLRTALGEVKSLSGLLPICSSCKRIRNKSGDWEPLEKYLHKNTDAQLTHGLCPECEKSLFKDFTNP